MPEKARCRVEGCNRLARIDGLCVSHQWDKHFDESDSSGLVLAVHDRLPTIPTCEIEDCENPRNTSGLCTMHYSRRQRGAANWDSPKPQRRRAAGLNCEVEGCKRGRACKGLCTMHYARKMRGVPDWADLEAHAPGKRPTNTSCSVDGCDRRHEGHGLCHTHLARKKRGDPAWADPIPRPRPETPAKPPKPLCVPPEIAADLRADYAIARTVNRGTPQDSPGREVGRRFNARIAELAASGHTYQQIAEAAGASLHMVTRRMRKIRAELASSPPAPCRINDCGRAVYAKGLCGTHYYRQLKEDKRSSVYEVCSNGYPRIPKNMSVGTNGRRRCKVCRREAQRRSYPNQRQVVTEDMHGTMTGWRYGCRCDDCRRFHNADSQQRRWLARFGPGGPMGPEVRERVLEALGRTRNVARAAEEVGVRHQAIYGAVRAVPGFGILVRQLTAPVKQ